MTKAADGGGGVDTSSVEVKLRAHGVTKGVLMRMAKSGQLLDFKCEMPQCYHRKGRAAFDPIGTPTKDWVPSPDHYPILKSKGGKLVPDNVRISHVRCNQLDYAWRKRTGTMLAKGISLEEIAVTLNNEGVRPVHGTNQWTAAMVRKAYVS